MTNKKTTSGKGGSNNESSPNIAPTWDFKRVQEESQALFDTYKSMLEKPEAKTLLLRELCEQRAVMYQLIEAYSINREVSSGASNNASKAVKLYEELLNLTRSQGKNFSKRIEKLEERKLCECETPKDMKPEYKATPREMFVTNYDEDDTCLTCSA